MLTNHQCQPGASQGPGGLICDWWAAVNIHVHNSQIPAQQLATTHAPACPNNHVKCGYSLHHQVSPRAQYEGRAARAATAANNAGTNHAKSASSRCGLKFMPFGDNKPGAWPIGPRHPLEWLSVPLPDRMDTSVWMLVN